MTNTSADPRVPASGPHLRSLLTECGNLELSLEAQTIGTPAPDEVVVRIEAASVNPSDLGLLLGAADIASAKTTGEGSSRRTTITVPDAGRRAMAGRVGLSMAVGNEGADVVIATDDRATALLGKTVALAGGGRCAEYQTVAAIGCLVLPDDVSPAEGASSLVNPPTALGTVETLRQEDHTALVHTAAASNLGQM